MKLDYPRASESITYTYSFSTYLKAGVVFAATAGGYFLMRATGLLPNWLQWNSTQEEAHALIPSRNEEDRALSFVEPLPREVLISNGVGLLESFQLDPIEVVELVSDEEATEIDTGQIKAGQRRLMAEPVTDIITLDRVTTVCAYESPPTIISQPGGAIVTWDDGYNTYFKIYSDYNLNSGGSALGTIQNALQPNLAVWPDGQFIVVYTQTMGNSASVQARVYTRDGQSLFAFEVDRSPPSTSYHYQFYIPTAAIKPNGDIVIVWLENTGPEYAKLREFNMRGIALDAPFHFYNYGYGIWSLGSSFLGVHAPVYIQPNGNFLIPSKSQITFFESNSREIIRYVTINNLIGIGMNRDGSFFAVSENKELSYLQQFSPDGDLIGEQFQLVNAIPALQYGMSLRMMSSDLEGNYLLVADFYQSINIYMFHFNIQDNSLVGSFRAYPQDIYNSIGIEHFLNNPSVALLSNKKAAIVWNRDIQKLSRGQSQPECLYNVHLEFFNLTSSSPPSPPIRSVYHYEYALMSTHVYRDKKDNLIFPADWQVQRATFSDGWELLLNASPETKDGYFGAAYINKQRKVLVIAHRGTNPTDIDDLRSDVSLLNGDIPSQYFEANQFVEQIQDYMENHSNLLGGNMQAYRVSFTGHSLGAVLAELTAATWNASVVVFESPGIVEIVNNHLQKFPHPPDNVVAYNAAPNYIDSVHAHFGQIYRTFSPYSNFFYGPNDIGYALFTLDQHSMSKILSNFNPITGNIYLTCLAKQWPLGISDSFSSYINYDRNPYYWDNFLAPISRLSQVAELFRTTFLQRSNLGIGVEIIGDAFNNEFWGGTNNDDRMTGGRSNDVYRPYGGNDIIIDSQGNEIYHLISDAIGHIRIEDQDHTGILRVDEFYSINGDAWSSGVDNTYILITHPENAMRDIQHILIIDPPTQSLDIFLSDNPYSYCITLNGFLNGQFGINLYNMSTMNWQLTPASGEETRIYTNGISVAGRGGDDIIYIEMPGDNQIYTGSGKDQIIYTKPSHSFRRLLSTDDPLVEDEITDFSKDDTLILRGYDIDNPIVVMGSRDNDTFIMITDLSLRITLRNALNVVAKLSTDNSSNPSVELVVAPLPPVLVTNELNVTQGINGTLTPAFLNLYDADSSNLTVFISDNQKINFYLHNFSNIPINQFSYLDILARHVLFSPSRSREKPSYFVSVSDGLFTTLPQPAKINFMTNNQNSENFLAIVLPTVLGGLFFITIMGLWVRRKYQKADKAELSLNDFKSSDNSSVVSGSKSHVSFHQPEKEMKELQGFKEQILNLKEDCTFKVDRPSKNVLQIKAENKQSDGQLLGEEKGQKIVSLLEGVLKKSNIKIDNIEYPSGNTAVVKITGEPDALKKVAEIISLPSGTNVASLFFSSPLSVGPSIAAGLPTEVTCILS